MLVVETIHVRPTFIISCLIEYYMVPVCLSVSQMCQNSFSSLSENFKTLNVKWFFNLALIVKTGQINTERSANASEERC